MTLTMSLPASSSHSASSPIVAATSIPNHEVPELSFGILRKDMEKQDAMKLVADSIAQQRQTAAFSIIVHPACLAGLVAGCTSIWRLNAHRDFGTAIMMICGLVLAYLAAVRLLTAKYIRLAESLKWKEWIASSQGDDDDYVLAARFGDEIIATLVLRILASTSTSKQTVSSSAKRHHGVIRAWTTKFRYRNKGIGGDMLRLAILTTRSRCGYDAPVAFDANHANSARPLYDMFNRPFDKRDEKALKALEHAMAACNRGESSFQKE